MHSTFIYIYKQKNNVLCIYGGNGALYVHDLSLTKQKSNQNKECMQYF